jgi:type I restriction enzyme, S subunit
MNTYSSYKESGVEWMGEIPSGWKVERIKYVFSKREEKSSTGEEELLSVTIHEGIVPRREYIKEDDHISRSSSLVGYKICYKDDLVNNIMKMGFRCLGISDYDGIVSPGYSVFHFSDKKNIPKYWNYLLRTDLYVTEYKKRSKGIQESRMRLYDDYFVDIYTLIPTIQEQQQISNYLDHKTQQIDSLIEKTQQKIELLKEQRTSLINQVVTKGLSPDVEMKDSGVEWIGEIPIHFDLVKLKYLCSVKTGNKDTQDRVEDGEYPFYVRSPIIERINSYSFEGESVLTVGDGVGTGKVFHYVNGKFEYHQRVYKFSDFRKITGKFFYWFIKHHFIFVTEDQNSKSTVDSLRRPMIDGFQFVLPPLQEQQQIVDHLDKETTKIDSTIEKETQRIELLKEYRQSLISEVVTGKVDVRDEVVV